MTCWGGAASSETALMERSELGSQTVMGPWDQNSTEAGIRHSQSSAGNDDWFEFGAVAVRIWRYVISLGDCVALLLSQLKVRQSSSNYNSITLRLTIFQGCVFYTLDTNIKWRDGPFSIRTPSVARICRVSSELPKVQQYYSAYSQMLNIRKLKRSKHWL